MADDSTTIELSRSELREVARYAAACTSRALAVFERERPDDRRPRAAIDAAQAFADEAEWTKALRDSAWAAQRAAREARDDLGGNIYELALFGSVANAASHPCSAGRVMRTGVARDGPGRPSRRRARYTCAGPGSGRSARHDRAV